MLDKLGIGPQVRDSGGNRVERRPRQAGQTEKRALGVAGPDASALSNQVFESRGGQDGDHRRLDHHDYFGGAGLDERQVANELHRVAETLFAVDEEPLSRQRRTIPHGNC